MKYEEIANKLIYDAFGEYTLDDILETLDDYGMLNSKGKDIRSIVWGKIYKGTETIEDRLESSWNTFNEEIKKFLISHKDEINETARIFINNKIIKKSP